VTDWKFRIIELAGDTPVRFAITEGIVCEDGAGAADRVTATGWFVLESMNDPAEARIDTDGLSTAVASAKGMVKL
jgi:hypothetical protein